MKIANSNSANTWATERKSAMEKAKQIKDERKFNLAKAGEMAMATGSNMNRITSSELQNRNLQNNMANDYLYKKPATMKYGTSMMDQNPSDDDYNQAGSALRLLKSKMTNNAYPSNNYAGGSDRQKGYFDEETHEYNQYAPGPKKMDQDRELNSMYNNPNKNNYRQTFKPQFDDNDYSRNNGNINNDLDYLNSKLQKKTQVLNRVNNYGPPQEDYNTTPTYGKINSKPPLGAMSKNTYNNQPSNQQYDDFNSKNIPSRIPQKNLALNKGNTNQGGKANFYDDNYNSRNSRGHSEERNQLDSYNNYQKPAVGSYSTKNADSKSSNLINYNNTNRGPQGNRGGYNDEPEDTKTFSKPVFKKNMPPPAKTQTQSKPQPQSQSVDDQQSIKPLTKNIAAAIADQADEYETDDGPVRECPQGCGRSFNPQALAKHAKICKKVFQTKRKAFDSSKARETDEQAEVAAESRYNGYPAPKKGGKPAPAAAKGKPGAKADWKTQSEQFRANLKAARGGKLTQEEQAAASNDSHLVQCEFCGRKFNDQAAARHIPFCQTKSKVDNIKKGTKGRK